MKIKAVNSTVSKDSLKQDPQAFERQYVASPLKGEKYVPYHLAKGEKVVSNGDSYICLGRDRPAAIPSGYFGETNCSSIDIVVGRMGAGREKVLELLPNEKAHPNFSFDSARIYVCQRTDIDDNFSIVKGNIAPAKNKSAIGMKADGIRILAREEVKIIAGMDEKNSANQTKTGIYGISLIGAYKDLEGPQYKGIDLELQPLVKGKNLRLYLEALNNHISQIDTVTSQIHKMLVQIQSAKTVHAHAAFPGGTSPPIDPVSITNAILTSIDAVIGTIENNLRQWNSVSINEQSLKDGGTNYILSKHNRTT